jgi:GABA(A) receptor-associated protein
MNRKDKDLEKITYNKDYVFKLYKKHPDKIPVIFTPINNSPMIDKRKFLIPRDLLVIQVNSIIRQKIKLDPIQALYIYFGNSKNPQLPSANTLISEAYEKYKDENGILYVSYSLENTFG